MSDRKAGSFNLDVRDTIVKSGLTGVAASILAVAVFSPAGLGGLVGTSLALGSDNSASAPDDPYARLPAFPSPLTHDEIDAIQVELAQTSAALELTRAATDERIEHIRSLALSDDLVTFERAPAHAVHVAETRGEDLRVMNTEDLRLSLSQPAVAPAQPAPADDLLVDVSYDPNEELAELLLTHELY
jgi:hypothetical protein